MLEERIDEAALIAVSDRVALHAGVVRSGRWATAILAPSGGGKSTLVAALCLSGFEYLSDEIALVDPATMRVGPYEKSIGLKPGGWNVIRVEYGVHRPSATVIRPDGRRVRFLNVTGNTEQVDASIHHLIVLSRQPFGPATLTEIPAADALTVLLRQSLNLPLHGSAGLDALVNIAERSRCLRLTYASVKDAVRVIGHLADAR
jgi:hypothetical protein